jgi:hypothetical protein
MQGYFGEEQAIDQQSETQHVGAVAPEGCWISQWRVGWRGVLPYFIQGVLNDGTTPPPINWRDGCSEDTVVGEAGSSFTAVHGR